MPSENGVGRDDRGDLTQPATAQPVPAHGQPTSLVIAQPQALAPQLPCAFMSGEMGPYRAEDLVALGAAAVIAKPFQLDEVARVLRQLCGL